MSPARQPDWNLPENARYLRPEHPPLRAWKFLERRFADDAARHAIFNIGTAAGYARLEDGQRDELDSAQVRTFGHIHVPIGERDPFVQQQLDALGIAIDPRCGEFNFLGPVGVYVQTGLALCLSGTPDNATAFPGKDAIVEISCVETLARLITQTNPQLGLGVTFGPVQYREVERAFEGGPRPLGSAFIKRPQFEVEREIRIFWRHRNPQAFLTQRIQHVPQGLLTWINP